MVGVALMVSRFLYVESCGQCPACKFGTGEVTAYLEHLADGIGTERDIELIGAPARDGHRREPLLSRHAGAARDRELPASVPRGLRRATSKVVAVAPVVPVPKLVDLVDGVAVYDEHHARKRPDWTYANV